MTWFPESAKGQTKIPEAGNAPNTPRSVTQLISFSELDIRIPADDLTVMIPYGTDTGSRKDALCNSLLYLLFNTTAKIKVYWSETPETLRHLAPDPLAEVLEKHFKKFGSEQWPRDCSKESIKFVDLIGIAQEKSFLTMLAGLVILPKTDVYQASADVKTVSHFIAEANGSKHDPLRPCRLSSFEQRLEKELSERVEIYVELRDTSAPFHRMKYLNRMLSCVYTPFVCNHDADVIIPRSTIQETLALFRMVPGLDVVYPYSCNDTSQIKIWFPNEQTNHTVMKHCLSGEVAALPVDLGCTANFPSRYGMAFFARTGSYRAVYGENEEFVSWGPEDVERYVRFIKLGLQVTRVDGNVFHLECERSNDSSSANPSFEANSKLWEKLQDLDKDQLRKYYSELEYVQMHGFGESR